MEEVLGSLSGRGVRHGFHSLRFAVSGYITRFDSCLRLLWDFPILFTGTLVEAGSIASSHRKESL